jgi:hypothetical protein
MVDTNAPRPARSGVRRRAWLRRELLPGADSWLGYWIVLGVFLAHVFLVGPDRSTLFSESLVWECSLHVWLLLGPPCALYLGLRHLIRGGTSPLCWVSVPLGAFLTALTLASLLTVPGV